MGKSAFDTFRRTHGGPSRHCARHNLREQVGGVDPVKAVGVARFRTRSKGSAGELNG